MMIAWAKVDLMLQPWLVVACPGAFVVVSSIVLVSLMRSQKG